MYRGINYVFIVPWFLLLALAIGVGLWRGGRDGAARGFRATALTAGIGIAVLGILYVALIVVYYATGGH